MAGASMGLVSLGAVSTAQAADPAPAAAAVPATLGEVIVTAQKRSQNIQSVGAAITALGKDTLAAVGRQDVTALSNLVPNLEVNQYSPTVTVFNIRGVSQNDFTDAQEAPIAFYEDEVYVSSLGAISGMNFDLDRIEVLRGPQGTLFGRNATGGLVQFMSARPTNSLSGYVTATVGSYDQFATEGAISGPLTDSIRARLSFTTNNADGYIKNTMGPKIGNSASFALRQQFDITLSPRDTLVLKAQVLRNDHERDAGLYSWAAAAPNAQGLGVFVGPGQNPFDSCNGCDPFGYRNASGSPFVQSENRTPYFDRTYVGVTARYEHRFDFATLTSITDYQHLTKGYGEDSDSSPNPVFAYDTHQHFYQASEELRLAGETPRMHWIVGLYGLNIHSDNAYQIDATQILGFKNNYGGTLITDSAALFGQTEYALNDQFSLITGLRYSYDHKHLEYTDVTNGVEDFNYATTYPQLADKRFEEFSNWSGKLELDYKPNRNVLVYLSANRGTKAGGFSTLSGGPFAEAAVAAIPFRQEVLTNYEGGFKLTLFDRTTHLNASVFDYVYDGYQAFTNVGLSQVVHNYDASDKGFELEVNTRPLPGLYMSAFLTVLDTKISHVVTPVGAVINPEMPQAPKTSVGVSARYQFPLGPGDAAIGTDWKYDSRQFLEAWNAPVDYEPARTIGNLRLSYAPAGGHIEGALFINNVSDVRYRVYNLDLSGLLGIVNQTYARPRTFGGSLTYRF
ncbi:TonB-dependent receptor [Phenylobacterium montanum]|uniref:TonB-dependent receptor n=1 Tax=Phenylobacterium montanum TaxID=2823693 RepID=A0A975IVJ9_9CAUL|nr:TonB-dependent receptor [Caulobacter sp. S6]QUD88649.1 TonB-dependent receptor [Caulobacter sp. S6]